MLQDQVFDLLLLLASLAFVSAASVLLGAFAGAL